MRRIYQIDMLFALLLLLFRPVLCAPRCINYEGECMFDTSHYKHSLRCVKGNCTFFDQPGYVPCPLHRQGKFSQGPCPPNHDPFLETAHPATHQQYRCCDHLKGEFIEERHTGSDWYRFEGTFAEGMDGKRVPLRQWTMEHALAAFRDNGIKHVLVMGDSMMREFYHSLIARMHGQEAVLDWVVHRHLYYFWCPEADWAWMGNGEEEYDTCSPDYPWVHDPNNAERNAALATCSQDPISFTFMMLPHYGGQYIALEQYQELHEGRWEHTAIITSVHYWEWDVSEGWLEYLEALAPRVKRLVLATVPSQQSGAIPLVEEKNQRFRDWAAERQYEGLTQVRILDMAAVTDLNTFVPSKLNSNWHYMCFMLKIWDLDKYNMSAKIEDYDSYLVLNTSGKSVPMPAAWASLDTKCHDNVNRAFWQVAFNVLFGADSNTQPTGNPTLNEVLVDINDVVAELHASRMEVKDVTIRTQLNGHTDNSAGATMGGQMDEHVQEQGKMDEGQAEGGVGTHMVGPMEGALSEAEEAAALADVIDDLFDPLDVVIAPDGSTSDAGPSEETAAHVVHQKKHEAAHGSKQETTTQGSHEGPKKGGRKASRKGGKTAKGVLHGSATRPDTLDVQH